MELKKYQHCWNVYLKCQSYVSYIADISVVLRNFALSSSRYDLHTASQV